MCFMYLSISLASIAELCYNKNFKGVYLIVGIIVYVFTYLVACVMFKLTIGFESNFELKTQTCCNGDIQIYGVNENGTEIFRFNLNKSKGSDSAAPSAKKTIRA